MICRWISGFSAQAQQKCFRFESANSTTRLSIFGVLACLNTTHISVVFGMYTGRAIVKGSYHFLSHRVRTLASHFQVLSSGVCVHRFANGRHHFVVIVSVVYLQLPG